MASEKLRLNEICSMLSFILLLTNYEALQNFKKPPVFLLAFVGGLIFTWILAFCGVNHTSKCLLACSLLFWTFVIIYWIGLIALTLGVKNKMACVLEEKRCPSTMWLYENNEGGGSKVPTFTAPDTNGPAKAAIIATRSKYVYFDNKELDKRTLMYPLSTKKPGKKPGKRPKTADKPKEKEKEGKKNDQASGDDSIVNILPFLLLFSVTMLYSWYTLLSYYAELRTLDSCTCTGSCCKRCY